MAYTTTTVGSLLELARTCREVVLPEAGLRRISESVATAAQDVPVTDPRPHPTAQESIDRIYRRDKVPSCFLMTIIHDINELLAVDSH